MKLKRRILSVLLTLAVMVTFMPFVSQQAFAASSGKTYLVTQQKNTTGDTVKYTYNKKGLVTKAVSKQTYKGQALDRVDTYTTTYQYNKKNKVKKATTTVVEKTTSYETSQTTGKSTGVSKGTVTTTTKYVTNYTYNKKGLATKSVTTRTTTMAGNSTSNEKDRDFYAGMEMNDGRYLADYYYKDGKWNYVYWEGPVNEAVEDTTTTTSYTDNGNGTYAVTTNRTTANANYDTDVEWDEEGENIISAKVVVGGTGNYLGGNTVSTKTIKDSSVTTTTYKYDKKKRVKEENSTEVNTLTETSGVSTDSDKWADGSSRVETDNTPYTTTTVTTSSSSTKYTYDKKGHAKKEVYTDNGTSNVTTTEVHGLTNEVRESVNADGTKSTVVYTSTGAECEEIVNTVVAGSTETVTTEVKPYTYTRTEDGVVDYTNTHTAETKQKNSTIRYNEDAVRDSSVSTFKYDKNGNMKSAKEVRSDNSYTEQKNETFGNYIYQFVDAENLTEGQVAHQVPEVLQVLVNKVTTNNTKKDNMLKNGTKRLTTVTSIGTSKVDRGTAYVSGGLCGKVTFKLKAKKLNSKYAKEVELQQWAIQNGSHNGMVGF